MATRKTHKLVAAPRHRTYAHRKWAVQIKKRACGKCELTGEEGGESHHIFSADDYPEMMSDLKNGIFIAAWIHKMYHIDFMGGYDIPTDRRSWDRFVKMFRKCRE